MNRGERATDLPAEWLTSARVHDRDRYISALLAPAEHRRDLLVLAAFDAELARIVVTVSEPMLAEIRLQWWRDALAPLLTVAGTARAGVARTGHPLADAVSELVRRRRLPGGLVHGLIDARSSELNDAPLEDELQLHAYISKTDGAMIALAAAIVEDGGTQWQLPWITVAGRAIGLARLARRVASGDRRADMLVPLTLWPLEERHHHPDDAATMARTMMARAGAVRHLARLASAQNDRALHGLDSVPRAVRPAALPLALVARYAARLAHVESADGTAPRDIHPLTRLWVLWRASRVKAVA